MQKFVYPQQQERQESPLDHTYCQYLDSSGGEVFDGKCIFCCKGITFSQNGCRVYEPLLTCLDFRTDAKLQEYLLLMKIPEYCDAVTTEVKYHTYCYESCLKCSVSSRLQNEVINPSTAESPPENSLPASSKVNSSPDQEKDVCIFCRSRKYTTQGQEPLVTCEDFRDIARISEYANHASDVALLEILSHQQHRAHEHFEHIGLELKYHASCYKCCVDSAPLRHNSTFSGQPFAAAPEALEFVIKDIAQFCLRNEILPLTDVHRMYVTKLMEYGKMDNASLSQEVDLKEKLKLEFGDRLRFCYAENGQILMYPCTLTVDELVMKIFQLMTENSQLKQENSKLRLQLNQEPLEQNVDSHVDDVDSATSVNTAVLTSHVIQDIVDPSSHIAESNQMELDHLDDSKSSCQLPEISESNMEQDDETILSSSRQCVCHIADKKDDRFRLFSDKMWHMVCKFMALWKDLDGIRRIIATNFDASNARREGYHMRCYQEFVGKKWVVDACKRLLLKPQKTAKICSDFNCKKVTATNSSDNLSHSGIKHDAAAVTGSQGGSSDGKPKLQTDRCILCHRVSHSVRFRRLVPLTCCRKGVTMPCLRRAALQKGDQAMLDVLRRNDEDPDYVLKYHGSCVKKYTSLKTKNIDAEQCKAERDAKIKEFLDSIIDKKIIEGGEIMSVPSLAKMLILHMDPSSTIRTSDRTDFHWTSLLQRRLELLSGDGKIECFRVHGDTSYFVVSSAKLRQILASASGLPTSIIEEPRDRSPTSKQSVGPGCEISEEAATADEHSAITTGHDELWYLVDSDTQINSETRPTYQCILCREYFESIIDFECHKNNSECRGRYDDLIKRLQYFDIHVGSVADIPALPQFECGICLKRYRTSEQLEQHIRRLHITYRKMLSKSVMMLFNCKPCNKWFCTQVQFDKHMEGHSFCCNLCDRSFNNLAKWKQHREKHNQTVRYYRCQECGWWFSTANHLKQHAMRHTAKYERMCPKCGMVFRNDFCLRGHMKSHDRKYHCCELCGKKFRRMSEFLKHKHVKPFRTDYCPNRYMQSLDREPHCCEICGKQFRHMYELTQHMFVHNGIKPFMCEFCSLSFRRDSELRRHIARHHKETRPYMCQECGKGYISAWELKEHEISHSGVKRFLCEICSKEFGRKNNFRRHMRCHTRPYLCEICDKRFAHPGSLKSHAKRHLKMNVVTPRRRRCVKS